MVLNKLVLSFILIISLSSCGSSGSSNKEKDENQNTSDNANTATINKNSKYVLTAWNDLGMHCMDGSDFSVFSVLPPYNNLHAQLKAKDGGLVTSGVNITYESAVGTDGKLNTISSSKTNFWDYTQALFGVTLTKDIGLTGNPTPSKTPAPMKFNSKLKWWEAEGVPITPYNDDGSKNYYPLVNVVAKDNSGNILTQTKVVLPVSDEMDCKRCHSSSSPDTAKPSSGWVNDSDKEKDYKYNILRLHDQKKPNAVKNNIDALKAKGYNYSEAGLEATAKAGTPILCVACHKSNALPSVGIGYNSGVNIPAFTTAIHKKHSSVRDPNNGMRLDDINNRDSCYACHPGSKTACLRGAMGDAKNSDGSDQMQCQSCHGDMNSVGSSSREGWLDEPNCQACHYDGKRETSAVLSNGTLRAVLDQKFATNANTPKAGVSLYRYSKGHGQLSCEACHGSTHAIFPAHNADNLMSKSIQGHTGTISECTACHSSMPKTTSGGPHGMHSIGDDWVHDHKKVAERNPAQCKVCHGNDYRGSELSKMWVDRTLKVEHGSKSFTKGHKVSCYDCHNGPSGDDD